MAQATKKKKNRAGSALDNVLARKDAVIAHEVVEVEEMAGSRVRFKLKMTEEAFKPRLNEAFREFNKMVRIPGFRPGMAPDQLVRARFEKPAREEAVKRTVNRLSEVFAESRGYKPVTNPYLLAYTSTAQEGTSVELAFEYLPQVKVTSEILDGLTALIHEVKIDESYVDTALETLRVQNAIFEPTDAAYQPKDGLLFDCAVTDVHGAVIAERSVKDYYSKGIEDEMPAEVAAALVGKKKGDSISLDITEPVEGAAPGTIETVHYAVELQEVKGRVLPALNDEFAKDVSDEFETIADLRKDILEKASEREINREREESLEAAFDELRNRVQFDLPRTLVDQTARQSMGEMEQRLNKMGVSLRMMDRTIVNNYASSVFAQARARVKNGLISDAVAALFKVEVSEDAINAELEKIAKRTSRKALAIRGQLEAKKEWDGFIRDLTTKLAHDRILEKVTVTKKAVSAKEFEDLARKRQEEQAARLRGEHIAAEEAESAADEALAGKGTDAEGAPANS